LNERRDSPVVAAARRFVALILDDAPPDEVTLAQELDALALMVREATYGDLAEEDASPPRSDYQARRAHIAARFPKLGWYGTADPCAVPAEPLVGDAIDDLADILSDLEEVVWLAEHVGLDDAHWYFRFAFFSHWGRHLRELALYLHARLSETYYADCEG